MAYPLSSQASLSSLICLKIFQDKFEQLLDNKPLLLIQSLNLWDLLVLLEVLGQLIEGGQQVGNHIVLFMLTGIPQFLQGIHHHDEFLQCIDTESQVLLGDVQRFQILTHIVYDLLTLPRLLFDDADLTDDLSGKSPRLLDFFAYLDVHHGVLMDLLNQLTIDITQLSIQSFDLSVQPDQRLLVREARIEVSDGVESRLFELLAHQLYHQNRRGKKDP